MLLVGPSLCPQLPRDPTQSPQSLAPGHTSPEAAPCSVLAETPHTHARVPVPPQHPANARGPSSSHLRPWRRGGADPPPKGVPERCARCRGGPGARRGCVRRRRSSSRRGRDAGSGRERGGSRRERGGNWEGTGREREGEREQHRSARLGSARLRGAAEGRDRARASSGPAAPGPRVAAPGCLAMPRARTAREGPLPGLRLRLKVPVGSGAFGWRLQEREMAVGPQRDQLPAAIHRACPEA